MAARNTAQGRPPDGCPVTRPPVGRRAVAPTVTPRERTSAAARTRTRAPKTLTLRVRKIDKRVTRSCRVVLTNLHKVGNRVTTNYTHENILTNNSHLIMTFTR